ncbi:ABC transporter substrate-binding protein [Demetria terragena]|uniref:ABC transporter substrate-binding protein n=1 Tax=Demetria terragena TaxID=63959 RepID=UPI000380DBB5|nr:ABC transporter substrate-binding protein [Demetria terragena]
MYRRSFLTLLSATAVGATLASCSTGSTEDDAPEGPGAATSGAAKVAADAFPVSVKHVYGTTTVESEPKRIATIGYTDSEVLLSIGVVPIGAPKITYGGNKQFSTDHFDAELKKVGGKQPARFSDADGTPVDEIVKMNPDLIVATNSGVTQEEYDKLTKIAPVIAYPDKAYGTPWQTSLAMLGKAVGRPTEAAKVKTRTEKVIKDGLAKYPELEGKTGAWATFNPADTSKFGFYTSFDLRPRMLKEFGLDVPPVVQKASEKTDKFSVDMSSEKASDFDADVVVFYVVEKGQTSKLQKHPLLGKIPAIKSGAFVASDNPDIDAKMSAASPLSIPLAVRDFMPLLAAAAKKA